MRLTLIVAAAIAVASTASANELDNSGSLLSPRAVAAAATFTDFTDFAMWQGAVGTPITRIGFGSLPDGTTVTNQFAGDGVTFTDGDDTVLSDPLLSEDGIGVNGSGRINITLSQPARAIGAFFPGGMTIEVFDSAGGASVYESSNFGGSGPGLFGGIVGDTDFSAVEIRDWVDDSVFIDDLVIGFSPPEGAVTGCIVVTGIPLALNLVFLLQPDEAPQLALTDANGCYQFDDPVAGKWFSIFVLDTVMPPVGGE